MTAIAYSTYRAARDAASNATQKFPASVCRLVWGNGGRYVVAMVDADREEEARKALPGVLVNELPPKEVKLRTPVGAMDMWAHYD